MGLKGQADLLYSQFNYHKDTKKHIIIRNRQIFLSSVIIVIMNQKELIQNLNIYRKQHNIFKKSLDQRSEKFQSVTYDGPPFASGTPHFGHGLTSAMKDAILRYKTMI